MPSPASCPGSSATSNLLLTSRSAAACWIFRSSRGRSRSRSAAPIRRRFACRTSCCQVTTRRFADGGRIQICEGIVIGLHRGGTRASFTVRKVSFGQGVERIFPLHSPTIQKVEVTKSAKVRRAKLYYLRDLKGKAARMKDQNKQ